MNNDVKQREKSREEKEFYSIIRLLFFSFFPLGCDKDDKYGENMYALFSFLYLQMFSSSKIV
jgi:hypothetical protein